METSINTQLAPKINSTSTVDNAPAKQDGDVREWFDRAIGETFFNQLIAQMRKTVSKPAYMHGGRAEEVFQGQLDQLLTERMTEASAESFTGPMFELFQLSRQEADTKDAETRIDVEQSKDTEIDRIMALPRR